MAVETASPSSRRAVLAGAIGAAVVSFAGALGRPSPANAGSVIFDSLDATIPAVRATNTAASGGASAGVFAQSDGTSGRGVFGLATQASGFTYGVVGQAESNGGTGVYGYAAASNGFTAGVYGHSMSTSGTGVYSYATATTGTTYGVRGLANSSNGTGVLGYATSATGTTRGVLGRATSPDGTGVQGHSGTSVAPDPSPKTGVYGYATQDAASRGVYGYSTAGRGVYGLATNGTGVRGQAGSGTAGYFAATNLMTGTALRAVGRVKLDKCAGVATILVAANTIVVTPGIDLVSTSAVVATLMGSAGPVSTTVSRVTVNATANTFTIVLTANNTAANPVKVAWHVFG